MNNTKRTETYFQCCPAFKKCWGLEKKKDFLVKRRNYSKNIWNSHKFIKYATYSCNCENLKIHCSSMSCYMNYWDVPYRSFWVTSQRRSKYSNTNIHYPFSFTFAKKWSIEAFCIIKEKWKWNDNITLSIEKFSQNIFVSGKVFVYS